MKKLIIIICLTILSLNKTFSQNLVPNCSFEEFQNCVLDTVYNNFSVLGIIVKDWFNPTRTSPDYFTSIDTSNVCAGYIGSEAELEVFSSPFPLNQNHHVGCVLMYPNNPPGNEYREYIESELDQELIAGNYYEVSFFTSIVGQCDYRINSLGVHFSNQLISDSNETASLNLIPQIQIDTMFGQVGIWTHIVDTIIASGGEKFMTIGNFSMDENTQFETLIDGGNAVNFVYYVFDSVSVKLISSNYIIENELDAINFYPNPVDETLFLDKLNIQSQLSYSIYSVEGRKVIQYQNLKNQINVSKLTSGVYFLQINNKSNKRTIKFIKT